MTFHIDFSNFPIAIRPPSDMVKVNCTKGPLLETPDGAIHADDLVKQISKNLDAKLTITEFERHHMDSTTKKFFDSWVKPQAAVPVENYALPVFDSYGFLHFSPKRPADPKRKYGVQAIVRGNLFEGRKNFRSHRKAREWVRKQLSCQMWPSSTQDSGLASGMDPVTMTISFDFTGPLDSSHLSKVMV
jgi:hypothetical protein